MAGGSAMKKFAALTVVVGLLFTGTLWAGQLTPDEKRALELKPAVVLVVVEFKTRWTLDVFPKPIDLQHGESGTGFIFRPDGYLITNGHVVGDFYNKDPENSEAFKKRLRDEFVTALQQGAISRYIASQIGRQLTPEEEVRVANSNWSISIISKPTLTVILANGKQLPAEVFQFSGPVDQKGKDVAVLKIPGSNYPTVTLGNSDNVRIQDQVMVLGYPGLASPWGGGTTSSLIGAESSLEPTATNGHISALKTEIIGTPIIQSDVAITHGNSGGPAFNEKGEVIGLATYGAQEVQGFNFLVPMNTAMEFVRQAGVSPEAGDFNRHWATALDLYDAGKCHRAMAEFENVGQFLPGLPDVSKYRALDVKCADAEGPLATFMESENAVPILAIVGIIIVGGIVFLVFGRRKPAAQPAMAMAGAAPGASAAASVPGAAPPAAAAASAGVAATVVSPAATVVERSFGRIQFTAGSLSGRSFPVSKAGLWIGRDSQKCSVVLQDDTVSGQHAWVVPADGAVVVIDKESTNGTYINSPDSPRISKVGLHNGDRVFLGKKGAVFTYFAA
jgi:serine protease Do